MESIIKKFLNFIVKYNTIIIISLTSITLLLVILIIFILLHIINKKNQSNNILTDYEDLESINKLFKKIVPLLEKHNIQYWIIGGTLLGAIRNKGIIPWDDDVDISILESDEQKLLNLKEELDNLDLNITDIFFGYKIYEKNGKIIPNKSNFKFPFIDIFITKKQDKIINFKSSDANNMWENDYFTNEELFPLKKYQFEDYYVYGPNNPYDYLNRAYPEWKTKAVKTYDHIVHKKIDKIEFDIFYNDYGKPILWQYWEGNKPDYIQLCMETVDKHCSTDFKIIRLNPDNIRDYIPEIDKYITKINKLKIPQKVDIYRIMLLYKYGGMYMDADVIVLRNPIEIMDKLRQYDFVGFGCTGDNCKNGYFKPSNWLLVSRQNTVLMKNIMDNLIDKVININMINFINKINIFKKSTYHDFGKYVIWEELDKLRNKNYSYYHYSNIIDGTRDKNGEWVDSDRIFSNEHIEYDDENNMIFLIIYNSDIDDNIKTMTKEEIINKDWNYSKFIKKSLSIS